MLTIDLQRARIGPGSLVLDLGCGTGRHAFASAKAGAQVIAVDRAFSELHDVRSTVIAMTEAGELTSSDRAQVLSGAAEMLPFADSIFDVVIASEVLEHVHDDATVLDEMVRVLKPGGLVALSVPRAGPEKVNWALSSAYHEVEGGHVRIYRKAELTEHCAKAGLVLVTSHHAHGLHSPYWWLRCAVGVHREDHPLVAAYHRLLVWDITRRPVITRVLDSILNPIIGKSLVCYLVKDAS